MTILSVSKEKSEAVIRFDSEELMVLCNALYHETKDGDKRAIYYKLYGDLSLARDLSFYGNIDAFCLDKIVECRNKVKELKEVNNGSK